MSYQSGYIAGLYAARKYINETMISMPRSQKDYDENQIRKLIKVKIDKQISNARLGVYESLRYTDYLDGS